MERALALLLAAQLVGCSWIGIRGVPPDAPSTQECTEKGTLPTGDTVAAIVLGGAGGVGLVANETKAPGEREDWAAALGISLIALAIPLALSAWWGFRNVSRCRAAHAGLVSGGP